MTVRDEQVQQAVIVKVEESCAPAQERNGDIGYARLKTDLGKANVAVISIKSIEVVREGCHVEVEPAIAVIISRRNTHRCLCQTIVGERKAGDIAHVFELAIVKIAVEIPWNRIIGDCEI